MVRDEEVHWTTLRTPELCTGPRAFHRIPEPFEFLRQQSRELAGPHFRHVDCPGILVHQLTEAACRLAGSAPLPRSRFRIDVEVAREGHCTGTGYNVNAPSELLRQLTRLVQRIHQRHVSPHWVVAVQHEYVI